MRAYAASVILLKFNLNSMNFQQTFDIYTRPQVQKT